jgi:hypothetical protein
MTMREIQELTLLVASENNRVGDRMAELRISYQETFAMVAAKVRDKPWPQIQVRRYC